MNYYFGLLFWNFRKSLDCTIHPGHDHSFFLPVDFSIARHLSKSSFNRPDFTRATSIPPKTMPPKIDGQKRLHHGNTKQAVTRPAKRPIIWPPSLVLCRNISPPYCIWRIPSSWKKVPSCSRLMSPSSLTPNSCCHWYLRWRLKSPSHLPAGPWVLTGHNPLVSAVSMCLVELS